MTVTIPEPTILRRAVTQDLPRINPMILRSKAYWGYDDAFMQACTDELSLTARDITNNPTMVATSNSRIVGVARITLSEPAILKELFVDPDAIGQGTGRLLFSWCIKTAREAGLITMTLDADPEAEPFYKAMGATRIGMAPSGSIPNRFLPQMLFSLAD